MSTPSAPRWPHCGHSGDPATDPVGCRGIHVPGHTACLAHLGNTDRTAYLTGLAPGAAIDHRATPFTQDLLEALLNALADPITSKPRLGPARFEEASFTGEARFDDTKFTGLASFDDAQFNGLARFHGAQFTREARFDGAKFMGLARFDEAEFNGFAWFHEAQFTRGAWFHEAHFTGSSLFVDAQFIDDVWFRRAQFTGGVAFHGAQFTGTVVFEEAQFTGGASFDGVQFGRRAWFGGAQFTGDAEFRGARFEGVSVFGPLVCSGQVVLSQAMFVLPVTLEIAAREVVCERTRWESMATVRVRHAAVDLGYAVLTAPAAVLTHPSHFTLTGTAVSEDLLTAPGLQPPVSDQVRVVSVQGVDAAHLVLTDTDLTDCLFSGAFHLDQIRLEGRTTLAATPTGWHRRGIRPMHWTRRRTLAEEHHWRAQTAGQPGSLLGHAPSPRRWRLGPHHSDPARTPNPVDVAALYRQLRKAFEDGKNEPGAADFYYGECEMRRQDRRGTPKGERCLLWGYWLLSGYGLRASRATGWLVAAMSLTVLLLMGFGLPTHDPDPATTGTLHGSKISLNTTTPDPTLHGGWSRRLTGARAEKATRVAVNSVVFRSSGQNLTTAGTYIEMTSRLLEPTLLALAALAVRGRIKR
ncbi:pentapeptide repeat-containing protein [Streptomyces sp. NPDC001835]|uniref:pentapeptide repeat-containing protein n=1 Tax=Streptomyces sp. NPDC001835 TaxID=3154528 RepID=UPI00332908DE